MGFSEIFFTKLKVVTNLILLISNITLSVSEVRNYHARLVKKNKITIPRVFPQIIADLDLLVSRPWKWKRRNAVKTKCFIYMHQVGQHTLYKCNNSKVNTLWFYRAVKESVAAMLWFYKKKNKLSGVRHCPELDMCTLAS